MSLWEGVIWVLVMLRGIHDIETEGESLVRGVFQGKATIPQL